MDRRWLVGGLVASVGLNLFLIGAGASAFLHRRHDPAFMPPTSMIEAVRQLPPDHQKALRHVLRREGRQIAPDLKAARMARRDAARQFTEPQFDRSAVLADLQTAGAAEARARTELETAVVDFAQTLPQDERASLAVTIRRGLETDRRSLKGDRFSRNQAPPVEAEALPSDAVSPSN